MSEDDFTGDLAKKAAASGKPENILTKKIPIGTAELGTILAGSIGLSSGLTLATAKLEDHEAKGALDSLAIVEKAAKDDAAPKTLEAIQAEEIKATSAIIRNRTAEGWLGGTALLGGAGAVAAASRIGRNKKKPGEETDQSSDKTPSR